MMWYRPCPTVHDNIIAQSKVLLGPDFAQSLGPHGPCPLAPACGLASVSLVSHRFTLFFSLCSCSLLSSCVSLCPLDSLCVHGPWVVWGCVHGPLYRGCIWGACVALFLGGLKMGPYRGLFLGGLYSGAYRGCLFWGSLFQRPFFGPYFSASAEAPKKGAYILASENRACFLGLVFGLYNARIFEG